MLVQFKGLKWINKVPVFLLFDLTNRETIKIKAKGNIIINSIIKLKCNGYYDLSTHEYMMCSNFFNEMSDNIIQCKECQILSGFSKCLGCDGSTCRAHEKKSYDFCNQNHVVYIALFGNNKIKVGTTAEYRKYSRILEQGAIASMFIAKTPNGKIARLIEHTISKYGYTLQVNSKYKINNLVIDMNREEIKETLLNHYNLILKKISNNLSLYFVEPEFNYCEFANETNKKVFKPFNKQKSLFENDDEKKQYIVNYDLRPKTICGKIINIIGTIIVLKTPENEFVAFDLKIIIGYIVNFEYF
jgi:hypothetical protein